MKKSVIICLMSFIIVKTYFILTFNCLCENETEKHARYKDIIANVLLK